MQPLQLRREATAISFALKMMSGSCKGVLNKFTPQHVCPLDSDARHSRHTLSGLQLEPIVTAKSLNTTVRGFHGVLPDIWSRLPQELVIKGQKTDWLKIQTRCKNHILTHS